MISHDDLILYMGEIRSLQDDIDKLVKNISTPLLTKKKIASYEKRKGEVLKLIFNELDLKI